jgi:Sec-independent protein translocase protein TatA
MGAAFTEFAFLLVILMIVFGFRWMPALGESIGRAIYNYRNPKKRSQR